MTPNRAALQFVAQGHQDKAIPYIRALLDAGHQRTSRMHRADYLLTDVDIENRLPDIYQAMQLGLPRFYYPHAARPPLYWDGIVEPLDHTASFVPAIGHKKIMQAYGYPYPIEVVGWALTELKPFTPTYTGNSPLRVLYGPIHPNVNGYLPPQLLEINQAAHNELAFLHQQGEIELSVRLIKSPKENGITPVPGVNYHGVAPNTAPHFFENTDVLVAHQTLAYVGVAMGLPTVMMAEREVPISGNTEDTIQPVASWKKYGDQLVYPLDILEGRALETLQAAASGDQEIAAWRELYIGRPFDRVRFAKLIESYL